MWAVIGIYSGREENSFYQRSENGLRAHGAKTIDLRETLPLGEAVIHAVTNPLDRITAAIHVYGGAFFAGPHSEHVETLRVFFPPGRGSNYHIHALEQISVQVESGAKAGQVLGEAPTPA